MSQVKFYNNEGNWIYTDGLTLGEKTVPSGNYRRMVFGSQVAIYGKENTFSLFKERYVEVTEIQKSETAGDNYKNITEFNNETALFFD